MNTKQAIYFLENNVEDVGMPTPVVNERIKDTINLLQRGEKYKQMWEDFKFKRGDTYVIIEQPNKGTIRDDMKEFEQKYFPKKKVIK